MRLDDGSTDRQAEAGAGRLGGEEGLEDLLLDFAGETGAEVADRHLDVAGVGGPGGDAHVEGRAGAFEVARDLVACASEPCASNALCTRFISTCWICTPSTVTRGNDRREVELEPAVVHARVAGEQRVHFADQFVDVLRFAPHILVAHQ